MADENQEEDKRDPFWFLDLDLEFLNVKPEDTLLPIEGNLMYHPLKTEYFQLCFLQQSKLDQDLKFAREKYEHEENYFLMNAYRRSIFLIADHTISSEHFQTVWSYSKGIFK